MPDTPGFDAAGSADAQSAEARPSGDNTCAPIRYRARFDPQAWVRDYAMSVDPMGETSWIVSEENRDRAAAIVADDGIDNDDVLHYDPAAPAWVREWTGPFTITVEVDE